MEKNESKCYRITWYRLSVTLTMVLVPLFVIGVAIGEGPLQSTIRHAVIILAGITFFCTFLAYIKDANKQLSAPAPARTVCRLEALRVLNKHFMHEGHSGCLDDRQLKLVLNAMQEITKGLDRADVEAYVATRRGELDKRIERNLAKAEQHCGTIAEVYMQINAAYRGGLEELAKIEELTKSKHI